MKKYLMKENLKSRNFAAQAREKNVDYRTIKKYSEITEEEFLIRRNKIMKKRENTKITNLIFQKLNEDPFLRASAIHFYLEEKKIKMSKRQVRIYVSRWKQNNNKANIPIRIFKEPGLEIQNDWKEDMKLETTSGNILKFNVWASVLSFSGTVSFILTKDRKRDTVISSLAKSFQKFNGVAKELKFDNMKTIIERSSENNFNKIINSRIIQFGNDYNARIKTTEIYNPQAKGIVESKMKLLDKLKAFNKNIKSWKHLEELVKILEMENNKIYPINETLNPIPNKKLHNLYLQNFKSAIVARDSMLLIEGKKYSIPTKYIGKSLFCVIKEDSYDIYDKDQNLIANHSKSTKKLNYNFNDFKEIITQEKYLKYNTHKNVDKFILDQFKKFKGGKNDKSI